MITTATPTIKTKWAFRDAFMVTLSIICLLLAVNVGLILLNLEDFLAASAHPGLVTLTFFLLQEAIFLIPLYYLVYKKYGLGLSAFGFHNIGWRKIIGWILGGYGVLIVFNLAFLIFVTKFGLPWGFRGQESHIPMFGESPEGLGMAIVVLVFIAPIIEELVFRGFLLQTFLVKFKPWVASVLTAALFAVIHLEFQSIGVIFILALIINWIFIRSRSIWPCIGFHMINNSLAFLVEWLVWMGKINI